MENCATELEQAVDEVNVRVGMKKVTQLFYSSSFLGRPRFEKKLRPLF